MNVDLQNTMVSHEMLTALSSIYISIHMFDLQKDEETTFKSNPFIDQWAQEGAANGPGIYPKLLSVMKNIVVGDQMKDMLEFIDLTTLQERLRDKNDLSIVFLGRINGWCRARIIVIERDGACVKRVLHTVECIDEEKKREDYLQYLAGTDLMTGIFNRGNGESTIAAMLEENQPGVFCLMDVDKFKSYNDTYGHDVGDKVLIAVANALKKIKHDGDVIMRLGGDEFAAMLVNVTKEEAIERIEQLFAEVGKIHVPEVKIPIYVSLGATVVQSGMDFDTVYKLADKGVYGCKNMDASAYLFK